MLLPHITCVKQNLYIGNRLADRLTKNQSVFLQQCSGRLRFTEIVQQNNIEIAEILHLCRYLLWWPNALNDFENGTGQCRRIIFCADAEMPWLGMGGTILTDMSECSTTIVTCFDTGDKETDLSLYNGFPEYVLACRDESALAAQLTGIRQINWNISLRKMAIREVSEISGTEGYFREMIYSAISGSGASEIFIPAALGKKIGAGIIQDTVVALAAEGYIQDSVHLYEDAPAAYGHRVVDEFYSKFEGAYLAPSEYYKDISNTYAGKTTLLQVFRCGITGAEKTLWNQAGITNAGIWGNPQCTRAERFWNLGFSGFM